jgi:hypothetical protein
LAGRMDSEEVDVLNHEGAFPAPGGALGGEGGWWDTGYWQKFKNRRGERPATPARGWRQAGTDG